MSGLITTRPASRASAIRLADQSAHRGSPVATSRITHESTSVAGRTAAGLLGTEQVHDLVGAHSLDVRARRGVAQPPDEALTPGLRPLGPDDLQDPADLHHLDLIAFTQAELGAKMGRYRHLPLAVQHHRGLHRVSRITSITYYYAPSA